MDQQPKYNRILNYKPESNRAVREVGPDQYASCAVLNAASISAIDPGLAEFAKIEHSTWHSGRGIRINRLGDQRPTVTAQDSRGVYHRNCMWFDVEIDKQYLLDNGISHLDTILRGNINDRMIYSSIWWPVDQGAPVFTDENVSIGPDEPLNPSVGDIWAETTEPLPGPPIPGPGGTSQDVVIRIWEYQSYVVGGTEFYHWVIISGSEDGYGIYSTTTINNIPTYVLDPDRECRFVVQVHWNMILSNTETPREMALYVFDGSTDATREMTDYIVKSPIVTMSNRDNPGPPGPGEPSQKGFVPAEMFDYYDNPRGKNLTIPITNTEIVMTINSGTATIDPNDEYEDVVFIDLIGEGSSLTLSYGSGSEAWVMAPVDNDQYIGNFPYYIGKQTVGENVTWGPTTDAGQITITGTGRFAIYGPDAILPRTPEIGQWLDDLPQAPPIDHVPIGLLTDTKLMGTRGLSKITNWQGIIQSTGRSMFRNVTGDFTLPKYQSLTDLTDTFALCPDFTDIADSLKTWITDSATSMEGTFKNCVNYNKNPEFVTNNITTMRDMFRGCSKFNTDINSWNVGNVEDMYGMFAGCSEFNQPLGNWNTGNVLNMGYMFDGCSVYDQFIAVWDVEKILSKPEGFDRSTTPEWEEFEKPWWGEIVRPDTPDYFMFEALTPDLILKIRGDTDLKLWNLDTKTYVRDIVSNQANLWVNLSEYVGRMALTGHTKAIGFASDSVWRQFYATIDNPGSPNPDNVRNPYYDTFYNGITLHGNNNWEFISGWGPVVGIDKTTGDSVYTKDNILNDISNYYVYDNDNQYMNDLYDKVSTTQVLGENTTWEKLNNVADGMTYKSFAYLGRLPDNMPEDLVFGWSDITEVEQRDLMIESFVATSNLPDRSISSTWDIRVNPEYSQLGGAFAFMPDVTGVGAIIDNICARTQSINARAIHQGSVMTNIDMNDHDTKVTQYTEAFRYADLTDTRGKTTIADLDHSLCETWSRCYMFAKGENHFVSDITQNITMPDVVLYEEFAYTQCVPEEISVWDFTLTSNITRMFYMSKFPRVFNNVDLSGYHSEVDTQGRVFDNNSQTFRTYPHVYDLKDIPNQQFSHVFTGCSGTPTSMLNWKLPPPKPVSLNGIFYRDVLIPWWFAGCTEFDCDLQSWETTTPVYHNGAEFDPITRQNQCIVMRIGTFALCENFNSQIDWYYPPEYYFPLEYMRGTDPIYDHDFDSDTLKATQYNDNLQLIDTMLYGRTATVHAWWRPFLGAKKYNNGGDPVPTIMGSDMVDTFRDSGIDQNITIRKPLWGKGYYQGIFQDTTAWTAPRIIDFECQNRSNTPELENVYYHAIMAQRMFKNSTFSGNLGPGFKWFFFNVTNVNGCHYSKHGVNKEFMNWTDYSELEDLRARKQNNTLDDIQTGSSSDSFDTRPVYNNKVMKTTVYGPDRAPQGNVIDSEMAYNNAMRFPDEGYPVNYTGEWSSNSGLVDLTYPPLSERYFSAYAVRPVWFYGLVNQSVTPNSDSLSPHYDAILFEDTLYYKENRGWIMRDQAGRSAFGMFFHSQPRTPVETSNMKEMFAGAINFTQDLNMFRTRLSPPSGALTRERPPYGDNSPEWNLKANFPEPYGSDWPEDFYFGDNEPKAEATFNRRAEGIINVVAPNEGGYARAAYKDIYNSWRDGISLNAGERLILRKISDYELQMIPKPSYIPVGNGFVEDLYPWGATFKAIPNLYVTIQNDKTFAIQNTRFFRKLPSMLPYPTDNDYSKSTAVNMDAIIYKSTTSEHYLIRDTHQRNGYARTSYDYWLTSALDADLFNLTDYEQFTLVDLGEDTLFDRLTDSGVNDDTDFLNSSYTGSTPNGAPNPLNHVYVPTGFVSGTGPSAYYSPFIIESPDKGLPLQNGHPENNYGNKFRTMKDYQWRSASPTIYSDEIVNPGPYMPDMDLTGLDDIGVEKPTSDLIDKPITETVRPMDYFVKSVPTNFATGADNFTSDKWPTWMVGYTDQPQSATDIENHFDPDNPRDPGDSRYITNYAWHHEPYNWPDGDIYRNGEY